MIRFGIITISDRSYEGIRPDASGPALVAEITKIGWRVINSSIVPDDYEMIKNKLISWCDQGSMDVILTTVGTGFTPRDITPEATLAVIDRSAPGLGEAMRGASLKITPHAMLSRAQSGIRKQSLIINLPGSPKASVENLRVVIPVLKHAVDLIKNDPSAEDGH